MNQTKDVVSLERPCPPKICGIGHHIIVTIILKGH